MSHSEQPIEESIEESVEGSANHEAPVAAGVSPQGLVDGDIVEARIVRLDEATVWLDLGGGRQGTAVRSEFDAGETLSVGGSVEIWIDRLGAAGEPSVVSRHMARELRFWDALREAAGSDRVFDGTVIGEVKGGLSVDLGVRAFLPASQIDVRPVADLASYFGQRLQFQVIEFQGKRGNVVVSRRGLLQKNSDERRAQRLQSLSEGDVVDGTIKSLAAYGAFVDIGDVDGLVRNIDLSWGRIDQPQEVVQVGQAVRVKVLSLDRDAGRIGLGVKQLLPDPWDGTESTYAVGDVVVGRVVSLTRYGAFVELQPGIEGLVHVSEMSWTRRVTSPKEVVSVGDELRVAILDVARHERRIALGLKQTLPNPWEALAQHHPVGSTMQGRVTSTTDFGVFLAFDDERAEGIQGLVHVSDLSWTEKVSDASTLFKKGDAVQAVVLGIDADKQRVALGIKQLTEHPWERVARAYARGTKVSGPVVRVAPFGAFIEVEPGIDGLCHISELASERVERVEDAVKVGQQVDALVLEVDVKRQRLALSLKAVTTGLDDEPYDAESVLDVAPTNTSLANALGPIAERLAAARPAPKL